MFPLKNLARKGLSGSNRLPNTVIWYAKMAPRLYTTRLLQSAPEYCVTANISNHELIKKNIYA